ncbi:MAG TPA: hypothetical protein VNZ22_07345 [Bacillota bacterium]|nr:hypothetical protein [Bacillota bacterium]
MTLMAPVAAAQADALDHWTTNQVSTNYFGLRCVAYGQGRYVAFGEYSDWGAILSSEDGIHWTLRNDGNGPAGSGLSFPIGLVYTGDKFFALGGFGSSGVSSNGIDWTIVRDGLGQLGMYGQGCGVTYGASRYVAVGKGLYGATDTVFVSTDGITWTVPYSGLPAGAVVGDIAYGAGLFVAKGINSGGVNDSEHIYTSTSGLLGWTQRSIPGGQFISFCRDLFVVPFGSGTNLLSADGRNWAVLGTGLTNAISKPIYANGLFMARAGAYLATSSDGTNWFQYAHPLPGTTYSGMSDIATDGTRLVTVSSVQTNWPSGFYSFNSFAYCSEVLAGVRMATTPQPQLVLSGLVGRSYRIEATDTLPTSAPGTWQPLTTVQLPTTPWVWTDPAANSSPQRFYRTVLLP